MWSAVSRPVANAQEMSIGTMFADAPDSGMRVETSVTSVSWIPSEAIAGMTRLPFDLRVTHYDEPPPDHIDDLGELHRRGAFRFANELRAWAEIEDGRIVAVGHDGRDLL